MKTARLLTSAVLAVLVLGFLSAIAMPPHPNLVQKMQNGSLPMPYYIQHEQDLRAQGVEAPSPVSYLQDFARRHSLDDNFNVLILLVDFSDHVSRTPASSFDTLLFGHNNRSLTNFISEVTYGHFTLVTVNMPGALGWVRLPQTYAYYVNGQNAFGAYPHNSQKMVEDAVAAVNGVVDFSRYDNDGDGYVDALFVVHTGPGAEFTGNNNDIWSHAWATSTPISVDGVHVSRYSTEPEYWQTSGDMTRGVFAHEMGHAAFGLPDLYDTDYSSQGIGNWSLMSGGSWNGNLGDLPAHPDAWCKIHMGAITPTTINTSQLGASIPAVETSPTVFRLGDPGTEYFLVENRQLTGSDAALPGSGLVIYHVDESQSGNTSEWYPGHTTNGHFKVAMEQANGLFEMEHNQNRGSAGDSYPGSTNKHVFDDTSTPNSKNYAGASTSVAVRNISSSAATMTADLYTSAPRRITVTSPVGGGTWYSGDSDTIRWSSSNITGNVKIEYNITYPSAGWFTLSSSASNTGWYRWVIPSRLSSNTRVRVTSVNFPAVADTSHGDIHLDLRSIWVWAPESGATWFVGDMDSIVWIPYNVPAGENVKIEINRSYPGTTWSTLAASVPNSGSWGWRVSGAAGNSMRIRVTGVTHPFACDTSEAFSVAARTLALTSPNTAITWVVGDSTGIRWTTTNMTLDNVKIELKRTYPSGAWETIAASVPNTGSYNCIATGPTTTTARVRITGTVHTAISDTSNTNFTIGARSLHVTYPNAATTCLIGGADTIRWTSTCMTSEPVAIQINRNYPSGSWEVLATNITNTGWFRWMVNGPTTANARLRVLNASHPLVGDTSDVNFSVAVPQLVVTSPNGGERWFVGDADTIRWSTQSLSENVKIEINRTWPTGSYTVLTSSTANTGWYRWVVTSGNSTTTRVRITPVTHTFAKDSSNASFTIAARTISVTNPATAVTWIVGDSATISWTTQDVPDDSVKIEINRDYSSGAWSVIAAKAINSGAYRWVITGPNASAARLRITGLRHTAASGISPCNFTIASRKITVTAPNTAVTWTYGAAYSIAWTSTCMSAESVKVELNRSYPSSSWEILQAAFPNTGVLRWTVTGVASTHARIRITGVRHTNIADTSNVNFTLTGGARSPQMWADAAASLPTEFCLEQNYPNPFNPTTQIEYDLPQAAHVVLTIHDMLGRQVALLSDALQPAGSYRITWNGHDQHGRFAGTGVYFYHIEAGSFSKTREMILLK